MRLINVNTLKLEEFHHKIPPYAILSHTWSHDEVTFQDYLCVTDPYSNPSTHVRVSTIKEKAGFAKIMGACKRAQADRLEYLWCDTNCIDKSSSAELTEAINSMYTWYYTSTICYAYLADVAVFDTTNRGAEEFRNSRWFTRGWTLQELLAPKEVLFFNQGWEPIAARRHLAEIICGVTRIHRDALLDRNTIQDHSVAQRMSWAADRQTSKQEDIAYCLLGIFKINMPLLYGEGSKAFTRLQEEIIKISDDQSIFAWEFIDGWHGSRVGVLASSPVEFASCGSVVRDMTITRSPYWLTNLGVSLELPMIRTFVKGTVLVELNCCTELREYRAGRDVQGRKLTRWRFPVWIWLESIGDKIYARSSNPVSRTFLGTMYSDAVSCAVTRLYGSTGSSRVEAGVCSVYSPVQRNRRVHTGFHVTISFGRIRPRTSTFEDAFQPGDFAMHRIIPRGPPFLSHEVISAGNYVVLLSMAWDNQMRPKRWHHSIFMSSNMATVRLMSANDWDILFQWPSSSPGSYDEEGWIQYIHSQIRNLSNQPTAGLDGNMAPFVRMGKDLWQDHHSQAMVVAHLTFQEKTIPHQ